MKGSLLRVRAGLDTCRCAEILGKRGRADREAFGFFNPRTTPPREEGRHTQGGVYISCSTGQRTCNYFTKNEQSALLVMLFWWITALFSLKLCRCLKPSTYPWDRTLGIARPPSGRRSQNYNPRAGCSPSPPSMRPNRWMYRTNRGS